MAIETGSISVTSVERTFRINIETPYQGDPWVTAFREVILSDGTGVIARKEIGSTQRALSKISADTIMVAGKTYLMTEIAGVISAVADQWRQEDVAASAAAAAEIVA
jgi:hypothetical protein